MESHKKDSDIKKQTLDSSKRYVFIIVKSFDIMGLIPFYVND
jgi:hypothetical protein